MSRSKQMITLLMATKNRKAQLALTLKRTHFLIHHPLISVLICDDGSTDGTTAFLRKEYPTIDVIRNESSQGIHQCRNRLFESVTTPYTLTMDDDLHFLEEFDPSEIIKFFESYPDAGIMAYRIFWGIDPPTTTNHDEQIKKVRSFGAGAQAMRMAAWQDIPHLPAWFQFYGEEDYMAIELFKKGWFVYYNPAFIVHHRVDLVTRNKDKKEYYRRLRMAVRSGWYLYAMFYPKKIAWQKIFYSITSQLRSKVFSGDFQVACILVLAFKDFLLHLKKFDRRQKLTREELKDYNSLSAAKIYWHPIHKIP